MSTVAVGLVILFACLSARAVPITYIFTGDITQGTFTPGGESQPTLVDLKGDLLTVSFSGDTNRVSVPGDASVALGCLVGSPVYCAGGIKNSVAVTSNSATVLTGSMVGTLGVFNNPNGLIGFQQQTNFDNTNPNNFPALLGLETAGTSLTQYALDQTVPEMTLPVLLASFSLPLDSGGTLTVNGLDATFEARLTPPQPVPEPATLALVGLVFCTLALVRRLRRTEAP